MAKMVCPNFFKQKWVKRAELGLNNLSHWVIANRNVDSTHVPHTRQYLNAHYFILGKLLPWFAKQILIFAFLGSKF